jgi:hypothetical protein
MAKRLTMRVSVAALCASASVVALAPAQGFVATRPSAKLTVQRGVIKNGKLDVRARISNLATGAVHVTYKAAGTTTAFDVPIAGAAVHIKKTLPQAQRAKRTGVYTLSYAGSNAVLPDSVKLRAAARRARLKRTASSISGDTLRVAGTTSTRARGYVRVRLSYSAIEGIVTTLDYRAKIHKGKWSLKRGLSHEAASFPGQLAIRYAGSASKLVCGEQVAKALKSAAG